MGNIQVTEDIGNTRNNILKKLYALNMEDLLKLQNNINELRKVNKDENHFLANIEFQIRLINELNKYQFKLSEKIPKENLKNVNTFIRNINDDLNSYIYFLHLQTFNQSNYNPLDILQLNKNFTLEELKGNYKRFSLITHPDRPNGCDRSFSLVNKAYVDLLKYLEITAQDKQHNELKQQSNSYIDNQNNNNARDVRMEGSFNINEFNKHFSNDKQNVENYGYNHWLQEQNNEKVDNYGNNFNLESFNNHYKKNVNHRGNQITKYSLPKEVNNNANYQQLGVTKIDNYSGKTDQLYYSDIVEALSNSNIAASVNNIKTKTINDLKSERNDINLSNKEIEIIEYEKKMDEIRENERVKNVLKQDSEQFERYDKLNAIMLQNVYK